MMTVRGGVSELTDEPMQNTTTVYDCSLLTFPCHENREGNISILQNGVNLPFTVQRVFYIYDIPAGKDRGAHAHRRCHQLIISVSGSFEVELDDGNTRRTVVLNRPFYGIHIPPGIWAAEKGFSAGSVCLVLASEKYDETDYIRDYVEFKQFRLDTGASHGRCSDADDR